MISPPLTPSCVRKKQPLYLQRAFIRHTPATAFNFSPFFSSEPPSFMRSCWKKPVRKGPFGKAAGASRFRTAAWTRWVYGTAYFPAWVPPFSARPSAPLSTTFPFFFFVSFSFFWCFQLPELLRFNSAPSAAHEDRRNRRQGESRARFLLHTLAERWGRTRRSVRRLIRLGPWRPAASVRCALVVFFTGGSSKLAFSVRERSSEPDSLRVVFLDGFSW